MHYNQNYNHFQPLLIIIPVGDLGDGLWEWWSNLKVSLPPQSTTHPHYSILPPHLTKLVLRLFLTLTISFRAPSRVKGENISQDSFIALSNVFMVFPSPQSCERHGTKVSFNKTLNMISDTMGTHQNLDDVKKSPFWFVLKCECI